MSNRGENKKRNLDKAEVSQDLKRLKIEPNEREKVQNSPSKDTRLKKGFNFLTACQKVTTGEYYNVGERVGIINLPDCCYSDTCTRHSGSQAPYQILPYEREAFRIDIKSGMWFEALDVFRAIIKHNKFPSVDTVIEILMMIINIDENTAFSSQYIIKRCQNVLKLLFYVHPPCSETVRVFYRELLNSPIDIMENTDLYKELYDPKHGLFKYIINILQKEIQSQTHTAVNIEFNKIDDKQECSKDSSVFGKLPKYIRIQRLILILELIVDLLERDLAIWISKNFTHPRKHIMRKQKPLVAWMLWQNSVIHSGLVNNNCRQIFQIIISVIELDHPSAHLQVFTRLLNTIFQTYFLCGTFSMEFYPDIRPNCSCSVFSTEMFNLVKDKQLELILTIIDNIKPKQFQFLMSRSLVQMVLKSNEPSFILLIQNVFKYRSWTNFDEDSGTIKHFKSSGGAKRIVMEKLHNYGLKYFYLHLMGNVSFDKSIILNTEVRKKPLQSTVLNIVFYSFSHFLLTFNIVKIQNCYDDLCTAQQMGIISSLQNGKNDDTKSDEDTSQPQPLPLNEECYREYRLIIRTLKQISLYLSEIKEECPSVYKIFQSIDIF